MQDALLSRQLLRAPIDLRALILQAVIANPVQLAADLVQLVLQRLRFADVLGRCPPLAPRSLAGVQRPAEIAQRLRDLLAQVHVQGVQGHQLGLLALALLLEALDVGVLGHRQEVHAAVVLLRPLGHAAAHLGEVLDDLLASLAGQA